MFKRREALIRPVFRVHGEKLVGCEAYNPRDPEQDEEENELAGGLVWLVAFVIITSCTSTSTNDLIVFVILCWHLEGGGRMELGFLVAGEIG